jgi:hypothetical protein
MNQPDLAAGVFHLSRMRHSSDGTARAHSHRRWVLASGQDNGVLRVATITGRTLAGPNERRNTQGGIVERQELENAIPGNVAAFVGFRAKTCGAGEIYRARSST